MTQTWQTDLYQEKHSFVWQFGQGLIDQLNPQPDENILDLGCGTGQLTQKIADRGARVMGLDADPAMIAEAQKNFPSLMFSVADAREFSVPQPVDAIFSNAVFHWISEPDAVAIRMNAALKSTGRLVVEFGSKGNMAAVLAAIAEARSAFGYQGIPSPWYFPTVGEYASLLENHGFEVRFATLFDRPTLLEGESGLVNWLQMFAQTFWSDLLPEQQSSLQKEIEQRARPKLYKNGQWWADYRRIRIIAVKS